MRKASYIYCLLVTGLVFAALFYAYLAPVAQAHYNADPYPGVYYPYPIFLPAVMAIYPEPPYPAPTEPPVIYSTPTPGPLPTPVPEHATDTIVLVDR